MFELYKEFSFIVGRDTGQDDLHTAMIPDANRYSPLPTWADDTVLAGLLADDMQAVLDILPGYMAP